MKLLYGLNASQFVKVNKLLREFLKFDNDSSKALESINQYINTLNYFLKDSAKELLFNDEASELSFNTLDRNGKTITEYKDIKFLSSGEQQILILFSYIAFNSDDGRIFIIDEPELSLHIKWQEDFLDYLEKNNSRVNLHN
ncbi:MAG: ATP-binding protein [Saprospiraceae bacterium]|nr:ATP-binding protein [Saprospiraceae bacterium]